jgi:hypothetical protein
VGDHVYNYNGSAYNNLSLRNDWTGATFDDTYQIAIVNNSIYHFSAGFYTSVFNMNPEI